MKSQERNKAREMRSQGLTINQIANFLQVSKSSVSTWVRDIVLTQDQIDNLQKQNPIFNRQINGAKERSDKARLIRLEYQNKGKIKAKDNNLLHQAGCLLYWAEGAKSKNQCRFTNSDTEMMKFFLKFIRQFYSHLESKITLTINYYTNNNLNSQEIKNYWLSSLELPEKSLRKCQENNRPRSATNAVRHNKLPYGVACISISSTELVQNIYGAIQQYVGFNTEYMLL